ncbi:hypothetical protein [Priestia megaterium]|uniref:hypothetical protein n=1 Tax=Priestia megaterium TaxID=1404 RepID=UPI002862664C|nr:hypothetical protein [Priestia megaterium]MDR7244232.1 hypothetical protein [Priestia megaterium]
MTTATTDTIETWKGEWKEFYNGAFEETQNNNELSPGEIKNRLKMLNHANENVDRIFTKLNEMDMVFDKLTESANALHKFLYGDKYSYEYQSLHFQITINEHIQISFEPFEETDATMAVECTVKFENDCLSFFIDEHDPQKLEISLKS